MTEHIDRATAGSPMTAHEDRPPAARRTTARPDPITGSGTTEPVGPAGRGGGRAHNHTATIERFTVLYDAGCPICRTARHWLESRAQIVRLEFVPAGSAEARQRFPALDHRATLLDVTVIGDDGSVYVGDGAWVACLWALADYRGMAERISSPTLLPTARRFIAAASAVRDRTRSGAFDRGPYEQEYYGDGCDDRCR